MSAKLQFVSKEYCIYPCVIELNVVSLKDTLQISQNCFWSKDTGLAIRGICKWQFPKMYSAAGILNTEKQTNPHTEELTSKCQEILRNEMTTEVKY